MALHAAPAGNLSACIACVQYASSVLRAVALKQSHELVNVQIICKRWLQQTTHSLSTLASLCTSAITQLHRGSIRKAIALTDVPLQPANSHNHSKVRCFSNMLC
jgi:ATP/maltotriose-dependent transcriptional regulator MalT